MTWICEYFPMQSPNFTLLRFPCHGAKAKAGLLKGALAFDDHTSQAYLHAMTQESYRKVANLVRVLSFCGFAVFIPLSFANTVRETMHLVEPALRHVAFETFLRRHGTACVVSVSVFSTTTKQGNIGGDIWSIRCSNAQEYAIFIANDLNSTGWFMPCDQVQRVSSFRCFEKNTGTIVLQ